MKQVLVRGLTDDVVKRLKKRAQQNHRSLQGELHAIITDAVEGDPRAYAPPARLEANSPRARYGDSGLLTREERGAVREKRVPGNGAKRRKSPPTGSVWNWLKRRPVGNLSKEEIDAHIRAERESWGNP
jgi:plasmid stability protein